MGHQVLCHCGKLGPVRQPATHTHTLAGMRQVLRRILHLGSGYAVGFQCLCLGLDSVGAWQEAPERVWTFAALTSMAG